MSTLKISSHKLFLIGEIVKIRKVLMSPIDIIRVLARERSVIDNPKIRIKLQQICLVVDSSQYQLCLCPYHLTKPPRERSSSNSTR